MRISLASALLSFSFAATALAAPANPEGESADDLAAELTATESVAQVYVAAPAQQQQAPERFVRQTSVYLGVPFFLTDRDSLRPGFGLHVRGGWEFGWLVPEVALGWQLNLLDAPGNDNLQSIWFSLGLRVQFLNYSNVVPFVSAAFRPTWFSVYDPDFSTGSEYTFEPGVTGAVGAAIELTPNFGLEVGVQATAIFSVVNEVFVDDRGNGKNELFLYPYVGATYYY
ncbi:MAG: hypothetical protein R3B99_16050 [Polyangiales bacterium]